MTKASMSLQDLRRRIYVKAKAEPTWRFWGLYVHVCKLETLHEAYAMAKANDGAPGVDGVTFEAIAQSGVSAFIQNLRDELVTGTYRPQPTRRLMIPKEGSDKFRQLSIPTVRDRVVQGALKLILEPIFEADFQPGSYGYRPKRTAHEAVNQVEQQVVMGKTRVLDIDLKAYFDNVRHDLLLSKVAERIDDDRIMRLLKMILKASGQRGVPQGGVISPVLSNVFLNEVDRMLERAKERTRSGRYTHVEYVRYADDLVVLIDGHPRHAWLVTAVAKRVREELAKLHVPVNEEKSRTVNLAEGQCFSFLGFDIRRVRSRSGKWRPECTPQTRKRTALLRKLKEVFRRCRSQPTSWVVAQINPILRGWVNYFAIGNSTRCFTYVRWWVDRKMRRHIRRASKRSGFGWKRWSSAWLYDRLGLFDDYQVRYFQPRAKARPAVSVT